MRTNHKPCGKRLHKVASVRRATARGIVTGRERATDMLLSHARKLAIPVHMPTGLRTARTLRDRAREWALGRVAKLAALSIERQTFNAAFRRLEASKVGGADFRTGVWFFVNVMKGNITV